MNCTRRAITTQHTNMIQPGLVRLLNIRMPILKFTSSNMAEVKGPKAMPKAPAATNAAEYAVLPEQGERTNHACKRENLRITNPLTLSLHKGRQMNYVSTVGAYNHRFSGGLNCVVGSFITMQWIARFAGKKGCARWSQIWCPHALPSARLSTAFGVMLRAHACCRQRHRRGRRFA